MRTMIALLLPMALAVIASAQTLKSTTYIEPAKSFLLGGGQPGAFSVKGRNAGSVPVTVFIERAGKRDSLVTLAPGANLDAEFPAKAMTVFRNESNGVLATLTLTVRGNTSDLGMRYEPAKR
ncbi:hypothetical protein [Gemmatimonas sp.]